MKSNYRFYDYNAFDSRISKRKWIPGVNSLTDVTKSNQRSARKLANKMRKKGVWNDSDYMYYDMGHDPFYYKTKVLTPNPAEFITESPYLYLQNANRANSPSFFHHVVLQHSYFQEVETSINILELVVQLTVNIEETNSALLNTNLFLCKFPNLYKSAERYDANVQPGQHPIPYTTEELYTYVNQKLEEMSTIGTINLPDNVVIQHANLDFELPYNSCQFNNASKYEIDRKTIHSLYSNNAASHKIVFKFKATRQTGSIELGFNDAIFVVGFTSASTIRDHLKVSLSTQTTMLFTKN